MNWKPLDNIPTVDRLQLPDGKNSGIEQVFGLKILLKDCENLKSTN